MRKFSRYSRVFDDAMMLLKASFEKLRLLINVLRLKFFLRSVVHFFTPLITVLSTSQ